MGLLSPHRRFVNPQNTDGIPTVRRHRPLPPRERPLPGTKHLKTPKDGSLKELLGHRERPDDRASRTAAVLGWAAMVFSVGFLVMLALINRLPDAAWHDSDIIAMLGMLSLGFIHVFAIFSQILSSGRNLVGAIALPTLYAGFFLLVILDHLLR